MTYLDRPRLHFAGRFQATPSTVNNDVANYLGPVTDSGWNPEGGAIWRLVGCRVSGVRHSEALPPGASDPVAEALVLDAADRVSAKLVDLDPEQQLASQIWGLVVRLADTQGETLVAGHFRPASFVDLGRRCPSAGGMASLGAFYQSTLDDLEWPGLDGSPFLQQLHRRSPRRLSIKFNVDGYQPDPAADDFTYGRVAGTIGPSFAEEPRHFVAGRVLRGGGTFAAAKLDAEHGSLIVDLGNSLPTASAGGPLAPAQDGYALAVFQNDRWNRLAPVDHTSPGFYESTAGVVETPLDDAGLAAVGAGHLGVLDGTVAILQEAASRIQVRADQLVFRLNPGDEATVELTASSAGEPPGSPLTLSLALGGRLGVREPTTALSFPSTVQTDESGRARFTLRAASPGGVRAPQGLASQVYGVAWALPADLAPAPPNPWEFLSVLVWDDYPDVDRPTWYAHVQPILEQYGRLYPVMARIVDLSDYKSVLEHIDLMALSFNLPTSDPNHMPVTRDLSRAKHELLRRWFEAPLLGRRPPAVASRARAAPGAALAGAAELDELTRAKSGREDRHA